MKRFEGLFQKPVTFTLCLSIILICASYCAADSAWEEEGTELVARITVIEGRLERFDPETDAWVITVPDAPAGINDQLFSGDGTRTEIVIPNNKIVIKSK